MAREAAIAFAGTPSFAVPALQALLDTPCRVSLVLTQPDRPAGRGRRLTGSAVKALALARALPLAQPATFKDTAAPPEAWGPRPDLLVVAAYGLLLPQWLLDWPRHGAVNVHASLLPRWRGAAPIQRAILAGDAETGISLMKMERGLDSGPVFVREALPIRAGESAGALQDRLAELGARVLSRALDAVLAGSLAPEPQDEAEATHAAKIAKHEARIDWRRAAVEIERRVRAFNPWPVAEAGLPDGSTLRIWEATAVDLRTAAPPGTVVAAERSGIDVATAAGALRIEKLQAPGGKAMAPGAYLNAHSLDGSRFVA